MDKKMINAIDLGQDISTQMLIISDGAGMAERELTEKAINTVLKQYIPYVEPSPKDKCEHTWSWSEGQTHEVCSKCGEMGEQVVDSVKMEIAAILRKCDCLMIPVKDKQLKKQLLAILEAPQPEPMPLIEQIMHAVCQSICLPDECSCHLNCGGYIEARRKIENILEAHDQQVRKDFAGECQQFYQAKSSRWQGFAAKTNMLMTYLNLNNGDRIYTEIYSAYKLGIADALAHLRAMAEKR